MNLEGNIMDRLEPFLVRKMAEGKEFLKVVDGKKDMVISIILTELDLTMMGKIDFLCPPGIVLSFVKGMFLIV